MNIAFLSRYQKTVNRGAESFVAELSKRLSGKFNVEILSGNDSDNLSKIIKGKYDLVIPINGRLQSLKASFSRIFGKHRLLITGHSGIGRDDMWNILVKPDVFVALTKYQQKWAEKWAWGSKILQIPNGIDLNKFSPDGPKIEINLPKPIILSVGALVWYKYHERVIRAVSTLDYGSVLIVGEGEDREKLESLGNKLLGERFRIIKLGYGEMPKIYRSVDLFTLPSWNREAFGIVYLEALSSGLGIVAPDDPQRREIIGDAGLFVRVEDPVKYAEGIDKALKINWTKKSKKQAEKFSWEKVAKMYDQVISEIIR